MNTKNLQKLESFCFSAILIISFLIEGNSVVSVGVSQVLPTDGGTNTTPNTIRLSRATIDPAEAETGVRQDGITHTESSNSHSRESLSNGVQDAHELCNVEDAPRKKKTRVQEKEGPVQEEAFEFPKRRRTSKERWLEGSSSAEKSALLSNTALKNPQSQPLPSKWLPGNFHDSESIGQGKRWIRVREILRKLTRVGKSYEENWLDLKQKLDAWVSKVEKIIRDNSSEKGLEESSTQKHAGDLHDSIQNSMRTYLGLMIAWSCYKGGQVDTNIIGDAWISEEKFLSSLKLSSGKRAQQKKKHLKYPAGSRNVKVSIQYYMDHAYEPVTGTPGRILYTLWYDWLDPNRKTKPELSMDHFNAFLRGIDDFGTDKLKCTEEIGGHIQDKTQKLHSSEARLKAGRGKEKVAIVDYEKFLIEKGQKVLDKWENAGEQMQEKLKEMEGRIEGAVDPSESITRGKGRKRKHGESGVPSTIYKSMVIEPSLAIRRVEKRLVKTVFPALFGLVEDLNRKYGDNEEREAVLNDFLNYLKDLISKWNEIDYYGLLARKIAHGEKTWLRREHTGSDYEELFWNGAFYNPSKAIPVSFLLGIVKEWLYTENSKPHELKKFLANQIDGLSAQIFHHLKDSYELAQRYPNQLPGKGSNKSQLVPFDFMSNVPKAQRTPRVPVEE